MSFSQVLLQDLLPLVHKKLHRFCPMVLGVLEQCSLASQSLGQDDGSQVQLVELGLLWVLPRRF